MLPSRTTLQWIFAERVQIAVKMHRIAKVVSAMRIALHTSRLFRSHLGPDIVRSHRRFVGCKSTSHRRLTSRDLVNLEPAFSQPCLCLSDARHFRNFRCFRGCEERSPCFQWVECKVIIFTVSFTSWAAKVPSDTKLLRK